MNAPLNSFHGGAREGAGGLISGGKLPDGGLVEGPWQTGGGREERSSKAIEAGMAKRGEGRKSIQETRT